MDIKTYQNNFKTEHPEVTTNDYEALSLGGEDDIEEQDLLANLIKNGIKTATTSAYDLYKQDETDPLPQVGEYGIILDGHNQPTCITKTVVVETVPFNQVSAEHAYHEGEGTRGLDEWRKDHWKFFKQEYADEHHPFNEELPCVCEVYKVVYK